MIITNFLELIFVCSCSFDENKDVSTAICSSDASLNNANDHTEQAQCTAEDLDNKDLDEGGGGLSISESAAGADNTDADTAEEVREADREA